ncbi:negative regulator of copper transport operon, AtkY [Weissella koreensis KACC 15510]|uniref:CopY/TcrY family copper transport repressor n=1 Tax=Weissella koreensis TaxID=165096 RepID=UPI000217587E|nr:CopY/TcrY family copper transport repressor [Weissella koreensis]AEJ22927.1 negative regulator of copper transport operon, AtkY [Weissella koreensis KACC 15510]
MEQATIPMSSAELSVMHVIWAQGEIRSRELIDILQQSQTWSESTIKTLLGRLVKKNILNTIRNGKQLIYTPTVTEHEITDQYTQDMFDQFCDHHKGAAITKLVETVPLSQNDIKNMMNVLMKRLPDAPEEVECHCLPQQCEHN